ncbi:hypothetical protein BC940DRAFT_91673 [Gongronella butleri]|nr:hypothetical protein BC940DRAFT_91673 [Gongronella butleri]
MFCTAIATCPCSPLRSLALTLAISPPSPRPSPLFSLFHQLSPVLGLESCTPLLFNWSSISSQLAAKRCVFSFCTWFASFHLANL